MGFKVSLSFGYHPQTNGQTKRKIQELGRYLRSYCHDDQHSWSRFLTHTEFSPSRHHQIDSIPMRTPSPTPLFPGTGDYWFRARECGTQLTNIFSVLCGGTRPSQIPVTPTPRHSSQGIRCGCPPGICASANRAES